MIQGTEWAGEVNSFLGTTKGVTHAGHQTTDANSITHAGHRMTRQRLKTKKLQNPLLRQNKTLSEHRMTFQMVRLSSKSRATCNKIEKTRETAVPTVPRRMSHYCFSSTSSLYLTPMYWWRTQTIYMVVRKPMEQNWENNWINGADSAEACVPLLPANSGRGNPSEPKTTQFNTEDDLVACQKRQYQEERNFLYS